MDLGPYFMVKSLANLVANNFNNYLKIYSHIAIVVIVVIVVIFFYSLLIVYDIASSKLISDANILSITGGYRVRVAFT